MPCKEWRDEWVAHLYGEVSAEERTAIDEHLSGCAVCRGTMQELDASRRALADSAPPLPDTPRVVVLRPRRLWGTAWAFAGGAVAATIVFVLGVLVFAAPETRLIEDRLARLESTPQTVPAVFDEGRFMTRTQFEEEMRRASLRHRRERAEDLDYMVRWLAASEQRTGTFMDRTQEALTYLALRSEPHVRER